MADLKELVASASPEALAGIEGTGMVGEGLPARLKCVRTGVEDSMSLSLQVGHLETCDRVKSLNIGHNYGSCPLSEFKK